jgi:hypothetical protein
MLGMRKKTRLKKSSHSRSLNSKAPKNKTPCPVQTQDLATSLMRHLDKLPLDLLARSSGFRRRKPKKLPPLLFVQAACLLVTIGSVSYRRWAGLIGLLGQCTLSKQALFERMTDQALSFLQSVLQALLATLTTTSGCPMPAELLCFGRVLLQDSTAIKVGEKLAAFFPGPSNQRGAQGGMIKIQACLDLVSQSFVHFSLSSYRRNDQAASSEVLPLLRPGDLLVRDLGYFVLEVLQQIDAAQAYFLSRLRLGVSIWEADGRRPVNLLGRLQAVHHLDGQFSLGEKKVPVRLVAIKLPAAIAAERRRQARQNRDRRSAPSAERLALLGWAIFISNVPRTIWSARTLARMYGLRWRIETIFKAWKSHFALAEVPDGSKQELLSLLYAKLIFITLFQVYFWRPWWAGIHSQEGPALSLLKVAQAIQSALLLLVLIELGVDVPLAWAQLIQTHCRYERRRVRRHFMQELESMVVAADGAKMK